MKNNNVENKKIFRCINENDGYDLFIAINNLENFNLLSKYVSSMPEPRSPKMMTIIFFLVKNKLNTEEVKVSS